MSMNLVLHIRKSVKVYINLQERLGKIQELSSEALGFILQTWSFKLLKFEFSLQGLIKLLKEIFRVFGLFFFFLLTQREAI